MEATWDRICDYGVNATMWKCSACKKTWEVKGILTPYGLGHTECPECHAKIIGVNQNVNIQKAAWTDKYLKTCEYDDRHGDLYVSYELNLDDKPTIVIGRLNAIMGKCEVFKVISDGEGLVNISELARNWRAEKRSWL